MVFRTRIEEARRLKDGSEKRTGSMDAEMQKAMADRQRAEAAKRKSDEMLTKELALKKEGESELKDAQRQRDSDAERSEAAQRRIASLQAEGARESLGSKEKDELLAKLEELQQLTADTDQLTLQLKRRLP